MTVLPPHLTDAEIADMCKPLRQGAAQIRYLLSIGVPVDRRPDGRPLVLRNRLGRSAADASATVETANEPQWSRSR
jgi:hypothetical protein